MKFKRYINIFLTGIAVFCSLVLEAQQSFDELKNLYNCNGIDWRKNNGLDFAFLKSIFDKHDILVLSEANHGDGAAYDAQMAMLKSLIDSGLITTVYTESNWMNLDRISEELRKKGDAAVRTTYKYMQTAELKYWADKGYWKYIADKIITGKIKLKGVEIDIVSDIINRELFLEATNIESVRKFMVNNPLDSIKVSGIHKDFSGWGLQSNFRPESYVSERRFVEVVCEAYSKTGNSYRIKQWQSILGTFYWMYRRTLLLVGNKYGNVVEGKKQNSMFHSIRDSLMAGIFLSDYLQNPKREKAVILISAYHGMRNSNEIADLQLCCKDTTVNIFADIIGKAIGNEKIYSVSFISAGGERGIKDYGMPRRNKPILKPVRGSLERYLSKKEFEYCLIDLSNSELRNEEFYLNAVFNVYVKAKWSRHFSAVFFIKQMYPLEFNDPSVLLSEEEW